MHEICHAYIYEILLFTYVIADNNVKTKNGVLNWGEKAKKRFIFFY